MPRLVQTALACGCGSPELYKGDVCRRCHRRARLSRENFGELREQRLKVDGYQCRVCGELDQAQLLVHHRRPGANKLEHLITLCRGCHVRVHRTWRPTWAFLSFGFLRRLWREANADLAEQRLLELLGEERAEQRELFH